MVTRRQTFRLYPNQAQEKALFDARRLHCYLYNACIANRRYEWKANQKAVSYFQQQNCLPEFKKTWPEFAYLHSQSLQATVKRVDLAYNAFFKGLRGLPKFKAIRNYSGWTYPAKSGWKVNSEGKHGTIRLNDLGITLRMRGRAKNWGIPTTLTIVYKPSKRQWFASLTVEVAAPTCKLGSESALSYQSLVAFDLGTQTALTLYDGEKFTEVTNPRFTQKAERQIKAKSKALRRKRAPNRRKKIKASRRWKKARKQISKLQRKVANQRQDWQHKVRRLLDTFLVRETVPEASESDIASRYDNSLRHGFANGVTEQLNTRGMTRQGKKGSKRQKQKAGLNKSILSVGFGTLNQMIAYKIESKGGLMLMLPTKKIKPSQRCPNCGKVHKDWAELSNRYHVCNDCGLEIPRDTCCAHAARTRFCDGTVQRCPPIGGDVGGEQLGLGTSLIDCGCFSSTNSTSKRKHTGSMKQLGQRKRQKSQSKKVGELETPSSYEAG